MFYLLVPFAMAWRGLKWFLLRWAYPLVYGSVWIVFVYSSMLIGDNGNIFLRTTLKFGGHLTVGQAHTGDIIVHTLPVLVTLIFTAAAWHVLRRVVGPVYTPWPWGRVLYAVYFVLSPLVRMLIYRLVHDPDLEYPSDIDRLVGVFVVVSLTILFNGILYLLLLADHPPPYDEPGPIQSKLRFLSHEMGGKQR